DAAHTARMKLGPTHQLLDLADAAHHRGHDAAGTRFERAHDGGVIGRRQTDEAVQTAAARRPRRLLDLRNRQADMLLIEPNRIEATLPGDHLDQLGITQLAQREELHHAILCKQCFQMCAHIYPFTLEYPSLALRVCRAATSSFVRPREQAAE